MDYHRYSPTLCLDLAVPGPMAPSQLHQFALDVDQSEPTPVLAASTRSASYQKELPPALLPPPLTLDACLRQFSAREQLGEDDKWYCSGCKSHVRALKTMGLWRLPAVLVIHLKRFKGGRSAGGYATISKISAPVRFPLRGLEMGPYLLDGARVAAAAAGGSTLYDLYAISRHSGDTGGGHYTALAQLRSGAWANFDDSYASLAAAPVEDDRSAYILFYRRRTETAALAPPPTGAEAPADAAAAASNAMQE